MSRYVYPYRKNLANFSPHVRRDYEERGGFNYTRERMRRLRQKNRAVYIKLRSPTASQSIRLYGHRVEVLS